MKILLCSPIPTISSRLGASRVSTDFADGLSELGVPFDHYPEPDQEFSREAYAENLQTVLPKLASQYDVVDFPFHSKPWVELATDAPNTLKVTRIMLLPHHEDFTPDPTPQDTLFSRLRHAAGVISGRKKKTFHSPEVRSRMDANIRQAHLTNVANSADRECLIKLGFDGSRIKVFPYGLTSSGAAAFGRLHTSPNKPARGPTIAFVGTFDYRKGCLDFPDIVRRITSALPNARFRLLGTKGMMPDASKVRSSFPPSLRRFIEIRPSFAPGDLPHLLADCSAGLFPSYREGFGIAVVEMLAAGLPVFAYNVPGPCDILPGEWLVERGAKTEISRRLVETLQAQEDEWQKLSRLAIATSHRFQWKQIASDTVDCYRHHLELLCSGEAGA